MKNTIQTIKKSFVFAIAIIMLSSLVFAQGSPEPVTYNGNGVGQQVGTENQGETPQIQTKEQVRAQINEIKQEMEQKKQQMDKEAEETGDKNQEMVKNQNQVRIAVHSLLAMEDLVGGIGPQVSEIARNFNNSVQSTMKSEEKIQNQNGFVKFFMGGDAESAEELETEVTQNQQRIQELKQLREDCDCDEEVKAMMQEQIQQMEQEQLRLKELAKAEKNNKGMFGWLWR